MRHKNRVDVRKHTKHNQQEVQASQSCGCLGCLSTLKPEEITQWTDEADQGQRAGQEAGQVDRTAVCPHCGDTLIIGDRSGHEISRTFLEAMRMR